MSLNMLLAVGNVSKSNALMSWQILKPVGSTVSLSLAIFGGCYVLVLLTILPGIARCLCDIHGHSSPAIAYVTAHFPFGKVRLCSALVVQLSRPTKRKWREVRSTHWSTYYVVSRGLPNNRVGSTKSAVACLKRTDRRTTNEYSSWLKWNSMAGTRVIYADAGGSVMDPDYYCRWSWWQKDDVIVKLHGFFPVESRAHILETS